MKPKNSEPQKDQNRATLVWNIRGVVAQKTRPVSSKGGEGIHPCASRGGMAQAAGYWAGGEGARSQIFEWPDT